MPAMPSLTVESCAGLAPRMFAVNHAGGEHLSPVVCELLDPADIGAIHHLLLPKESATALHYHDYDEYWAWTRGRTMVTIRLPDGRRERFEISPGWIVYCVRGVEHGHEPLEDWGCYEWKGLARPGARLGHLERTF